MFLALREMRRAMVRFALLMASIGLLVFLILFQQTLQNGLITSFVGAIEQQSAPVLVYSVDGRRNLQGSIITPALEEQIRGVDGVGAAGLIGQGTFSVTAAGELSSAAVIGYSDPALGAPDSMVSGRLPESTGEVVAIDSAAADGFDVGDTVTVEPGGLDLKVVGLAERIGYQASTTLFTTYATYEAAVRAANPDAGGILPAVMALDAGRGRHGRGAGRARQRRRARGRRADPGRRCSRDPRGGAGSPVLPGDLPALRTGHPADHRAVLPHHHPAEGQLAHAAPSGRRARAARWSGRCCSRCSS